MFPQLSAYAFGALLILTSLNAFRAPSDFGQAWGLPQPLSSSTSPWLYATAARNFNLGLIMLMLGYLKDAKALGVVYLCTCVQGHFDITISARNGPQGAYWGHLIGTAVLFLMGSYLFFFWWGSGRTKKL